MLILSLLLPLTITASEVDPDTLGDIFPLAVGNQWTYQYQTYLSIWTGEIYTDSGNVQYTVTGRFFSQDSTQWTFQEIRNIISCIDYNLAQRPGGQRSCSTVIDTNIFQITELHDERHRLYRTESTSQLWKSVFPWGVNLIDTSAIYRYLPVDHFGTVNLTTRYYPYPTGTYNFSFKQGLGLVSVRYSSFPYSAGAVFGTWHDLINSIVTHIEAFEPQSKPSSIILRQNYPNPFNLITEISFWLPEPTHTKLTVFNILGQPVASLLHKMMSAGQHVIQWNASSLPSGIYFYRLETESSNRTLRALLLK
jgi:hypothetical protein